MIKANIHQVKTHFSEYLTKIEHGENIIICKRNIPIAELRSLPHHPVNPRPLGLAKGTFEIPPAFFEPLPEDIIRSFHSDD